MNSSTGLIRDSLKNRKFKEEAEIYFSSSSTLEIKAYEGGIASFSFADTSGLGARVLAGKKMGQAFTEKVDAGSIGTCLEKARENASFLPDDEGSAIFRSREEKYYDTFRSDDLDDVSVEQKKELALAMEKHAMAFDSRIVNVPESIYSEVANERIVANSYGLFKSEKASLCYAYVYLMASDGKDTSVGYYFQSEKNFRDLDPVEIAEKAARDALEKLGAEEIDSGSYPVLFSASAASSLMGAFINSGGSAFFGENIQKGRSRLEGKAGQAVGASIINIIDDPAIFSPGTACFDDEGIDTSRRYIIRNGVFETVLHNLYSAGRGNTESTGNGSRGYSSPLSTRLFTPYLEPSDRSEESLFAEAGSGVYVTDVEGLHAGLNQISGDFSVGARGFLIRNGQKGKAVKNFTVAGNFFDILKTVRAVGNNNRFNGNSDFSSPSLLAGPLPVSGR